MAERKDDKKSTTTGDKQKPKIAQTDKYYKIKADFSYLATYNYRITKEIGRGGYGVVYKVTVAPVRRSKQQEARASKSTQ